MHQIKKIAGLIVTLCWLNVAAQTTNPADTTRRLWLNTLNKIARPVLSNLAEDKLKQNMPVALSEHTDNKKTHTKAAYLEAFGRTLSGIAPWLQLEGGDAEEAALRNQYRQWCLKAIANAVNPQAKDYLQWQGGQPLVDASFFALGLIRCPWLWQHLDTTVKQQVATALRSTRATVPGYSNWVLFTGMIEAFFCQYGLGDDAVRTEYGIREFTQHWYVGDGMYSDGMNFHFDYYNSIVIHPFLSTILQVQGDKKKQYVKEAQTELFAGRRYAEILERLINTDGSYPATGRSITYRAGVFHHLANMAFIKQLPSSLSPAQVRCGLTAMLKKTTESATTFTQQGWLNIGLYGSQPGLADFYITTGSLYICTEIFLPLGLPAEDAFWSAPPQPWTAVKIWTGMDANADHALDIK